MKKKNTYRVKRLSGLAMFLIPVMLLSCEKGDDASSLTVENTIQLGSEAGEYKVSLKSSMSWKIEYASDWFETDTYVGSASRDNFTITYDANDTENNRKVTIVISTDDKKVSKQIEVTQLSQAPYLTIDKTEYSIISKAKSYSLEVSTNISANDLQIVPSEWISDVSVADGKLNFTVPNNPDASTRTGTVKISYSDSYDRNILVTVTITQAAKSDYDNAVLKSLDYVKTLSAGEITEDIYITGNIVLDGTSSNYTEGRYSIQDAAGKAILFETAENLAFQSTDFVSLWLKGASIEQESEGTFDYNVITGFTTDHLIDMEEDDSFTLPEVFLGDLTNDNVFAVVTLKQTEIASPKGRYINMINDFKATFPNYYRFYPTCIRDVNGDNSYLLTNPAADFALSNLPQGGGSITGIVVREKNTNFYIYEDQICIRPRTEADVALAADRDTGFTSVLVEWDTKQPSDLTSAAPYVGKYIPPVIGPATAVLSKYKCPGFYTNRPTTYEINFHGMWRGLALEGGAYNGAAWDGGATVSGASYTNWNETDHAMYWYVDKISTKGITGQLSMQIEANSSEDEGPRDFVVEYATSLSGPWTEVEKYVCLGQMHATKYNEFSVPGYKVYDFKLPSALNDKDNITIRMRVYTTVGSYNRTLIRGTSRLASVSLKYNK